MRNLPVFSFVSTTSFQSCRYIQIIVEIKISCSKRSFRQAILYALSAAILRTGSSKSPSQITEYFRCNFTATWLPFWYKGNTAHDVRENGVYTFLVDIRCAHHYTTFQNHNQIVTVVRHRLKLLDIIDIWVCIKKKSMLAQNIGDFDTIRYWSRVLLEYIPSCVRGIKAKLFQAQLYFTHSFFIVLGIRRWFRIKLYFAAQYVTRYFFTLLSLETTLSLTSLYRDRYRMSKKQQQITVHIVLVSDRTGIGTTL